MSRITPATLLVLIFAVLFGIVAAYVVRRQFMAEEPIVVTPPPDQTVIVPLASMDLEAGKQVALIDVALVPITRAGMSRRNPPLPAEMMANPQQIIGKILREPVKKGEAFLPKDFYPEGTYPSIVQRLKPGQRAVTVPIKGAGALAGYAAPGARVDVMFRTKARGDEIPDETITLLQDAEILALGDNSTVGKLGGIKPTADSNPVTLAVSPADAQRLKVVEGQGDLSLTLRGENDKLADNTNPMSLEMLLGIRKRPGPWTADIYRRGGRQTIRFQNNQVVDERFSGTPLPAPNVDKPADDTNKPGPQTTIIVPQTTPSLPFFPWQLGPMPYYPQFINPGLQVPSTLPGTVVP